MFKKIKHELYFIKKEDLLSVFVFLASIIPSLVARVILKIKGRHIWLVTEDRNEARDNGICFFRYLNQKDIHQDSYYAISYHVLDYETARSIGKTVKYGSVMHWVLYFNSEYNISTQKAGRPGTAVGYVLEQLGLLKNKQIFLQHGITLSNATWLYYNNTKMRLFICGAKPEYEYVSKLFGYPEGYVAYTGFCRFDDYHHVRNKKRQILLIPSWREWIGSKNEYSGVYEDTSVFENTEYYKKYQSLINNVELCGLLQEKEIYLYFYPHRNMQQFVRSFTTRSERIKIVDNKTSSIRDLLMESALMITDYSSVALDFAYMKKPVVFYQFDVERFRQAQYAEGYFDYKACGLGKWTDDEQTVIEYVKDCIDRDFGMDERFEEAHRDFFTLYDDKNCERVFSKIRDIKNEKNRAVGL